LDKICSIKKGRIYLVGAGPGDPGLMTVKAVECLKKADAVVYDRLLDIDITEYVRPDTELIYAGKSPDKHTLKQSEINKLLSDLALQGKTVVRLKGGDPFVLGRGGEEAEHLKSQDIEFEIVPGITSAIAVPAYAGIPVTHRGLASSFAVITGHEDPVKEYSSVNWEKLSMGVDTLVFLMAMAHLDQIVNQLIKNGRPADTPVAVITEGTRTEQRVVSATLDKIAGVVKANNIRNPAVVVVGLVAGLRSSLQWFDSRPLFARRILVTRSRQQASRLSKLLAEKGAIPVEQPAIIIRPVEDTRQLDEAISSLEKFDWLIFTSVNGVSVFFKRLSEMGLDSRRLNRIRVGVIGPATGEALLKYGISADYMPPEYTGRSFVEHLGTGNTRGKHFLLPRARAADNEIPAGIEAHGGKITEIPVYDTFPDQPAMRNVNGLLQKRQIDVATFASSSTVTSLVDALDGNAGTLLKGVVIACIGPKTAETAMAAGLPVDIIASESTIPGMVRAIEEYYEKGR